MPELQGKCKKCDVWVTNGTRPPCVVDERIPEDCGVLGPIETRTVETFDERRATQASKQSDAVDWDKLWEATFKQSYPHAAPGWLEASPDADVPHLVTDTSAGRLDYTTGLIKPWESKGYPENPVTALDVQVGGSHYKDAGIQPVEYIFANKLGFCEGNVIKYVTRYQKKNGVQDLKKARHYLDMLIEELEKVRATDAA